MRFYIDPGTGSMLFAILIGIIGAVTYMLKSWLLKLRFVLSGGKKVDTGAKKIPLVIFSDDKRYWSVFRPVCRELDKKGIDTVYMTASPDDPALENDLPHIHAQFIEEGNKAFAKLNFLNASVVLATTPGAGCLPVEALEAGRLLRPPAARGQRHQRLPDVRHRLL